MSRTPTSGFTFVWVELFEIIVGPNVLPTIEKLAWLILPLMSGDTEFVLLATMELSRLTVPVLKIPPPDVVAVLNAMVDWLIPIVAFAVLL